MKKRSYLANAKSHMPFSAHPLSHHYNCSQKWKFYTSFPPNFFNFLMVFHSLKSNEHDRGRAFLKISMLIHPQTFQDPSPFFTPLHLFIPFPPMGWLSFLSSLSNFHSLTSLSQAPLCFHLKTKIYVNLWAGLLMHSAM